MSALAYGVVAWLFLVGIYGVVTSRNLIHLVVCLAQQHCNQLLIDLVVFGKKDSQRLAGRDGARRRERGRLRTPQPGTSSSSRWSLFAFSVTTIGPRAHGIRA